MSELPITWDQFHTDVRILANHIQSSGNEFDTIVAITRGGLVPAAILAQLLNVRYIETLGLSSRDDDRERTIMSVIKTVNTAVFNTGGSNTLVVDDLVDSGHTMRYVAKLLPRAYRAVVYAKPLGRDACHVRAADMPQDRWLVFPWEQ